MSNFYGLLGEKLGHSLSPQIHSMIFERINCKGLYNLFEVKKENLGAAIKGLSALGTRGINVTIPYKIDIIQYLDRLSEEAGEIGAVNTISFENNIVTGYNTDYFGFGASLNKAEIKVENKRIAILGTGGVSKAVVQYLMDNNAKQIVFVSRKPELNTVNISNIKSISYNELNNYGDGDIIINCTPVGMHPFVEASPVGCDILSHFKIAVDLIYNPGETIFLRSAENLGLKTLNGLYMLVAQAIAANEIWKGIKISNQITDEIYNILKSRF